MNIAVVSKDCEQFDSSIAFTCVAVGLNHPLAQHYYDVVNTCLISVNIWRKPLILIDWLAMLAHMRYSVRVCRFGGVTWCKDSFGEPCPPPRA